MVVALSTNVIFAKSLTGRKFTGRFDWAKNKLLINGIITTMAAIAPVSYTHLDVYKRQD